MKVLVSSYLMKSTPYFFSFLSQVSYHSYHWIAPPSSVLSAFRLIKNTGTYPDWNASIASLRFLVWAVFALFDDWLKALLRHLPWICESQV